MEKIATFSDGSILEYGKGAFDDWCVFLTRPNEKRYAPKDSEYFSRISDKAKVYGEEKIYNDFVSFYIHTSKSIDRNVLQKILTLASSYSSDANSMAIDFTIIYMGMVAEENKVFTKLGKRVKRLGMHQILKEHMPCLQAANFSRGKKWRELDEMCLSSGF